MNIGYLLVSALVLILGALQGCAGKMESVLPESKTGIPPQSHMVAVGRWGMPDCTDDMMDAGLKEAIEQSLAYYRRLDKERVLWFGEDSFKVKDIENTLEQFLSVLATTPPGKDRKKALRTAFRMYRAGGEQKKVLFTAYYEPVLRGSRLPGIDYQVPLYGVPKDLVVVDLGLFRGDLKGMRVLGRYEQDKLVPYYTRREIDRLGLLQGRGLEIAWIEDPVAAFFLHIQGSGRIILPNGSTLLVHYAASNGRPYRSIGTMLIETGKVPKEEGSLSGILEYLRNNPEGRDAALDYNESYVFFDEVQKGPLGNLNVVLTAGRSVATDQQLYPPGALAYVETEIPVLGKDGLVAEWKHVGRFVLNQDTGGAIRAAGRCDIYIGQGDKAGKIAGSTYQEGKLYYLFLKK